MLGMRGIGQKTPCPDGVCASHLKTSRPTINSTLICGLSFRARFGTQIVRTREGMAMARAKGKLRGKRPKLSDKQHKELWWMYETGEYSTNDLAELFAVSRPTVYRTLARKTQRSSGR
jgi:DNA invertase Pin-like site-specific DNA recombinase